MSNNKRIPELPLIPTANQAQLLALYDPTTDVTYRVEVSKIIASGGFVPDQWDPLINYLIGAIVSHDSGFGQQVWVAINDNTNSEPVAGSPDWRLATATDLNMKMYTIDPGDITVNFDGLSDAVFKISGDIDGDRTWSFLNADNLIRATIFVNLTGLGSWNQDFSGIAPTVISDNGNWDSGSKQWQPIQAGKYKLVLEFDGSEYVLTISNLIG